MDTRSTKFKYSVFAKGLCFFLAVLTFFSFAFFAIKTVGAIEILGFEEFLSGKHPTFTQSYGFRSKFSEDFYHVRNLLSNNADNIDKAFDAHKDEIVNAALGSYLDQKAKIIEDELKYAVENYDDSYFNYEYTADAIVIPEATTQAEISTVSPTVTSAEEPATDVNGEDIPRNIQAAQKILQTAKGRDFLNYAALVRDEAFNSSEFHYETVIKVSENYNTSVHLSCSDFYPDEQAIKKQFLQQYTNIHSNLKNEAETEAEVSRYMLSDLKAFKYYAVDDKGFVYSNLENKPMPDAIEKNDAYVYFDGENTVIGNLEENQKKYIKQVLSDTKNCEIYIFVDDNLTKNSGDAYNHLWTAYTELNNTSAQRNIALMVVFLLVSILLVIVFLCLCGHKNGEDKPVTAYIDRLPTDLHFILSFGCIAGLAALAGFLGIAAFEEINTFADLLLTYIPWIISALLTFSYMLFIEWLSSAVRIKKAGQKFFAKMLITKLIIATGRLIRKLYIKTASATKKCFSTLAYKPKKMQKRVILIIFGYVLGNLLFILFATFAYYEAAIALLVAVLAMTYNAACLYFMLKYFKNLDKIIDASCRHEPVDFGGEKIPESLRLLASNLTDTNKALHEAVAKAIRDEQMKTELITNVSHDLKTPLTSLISYSDLLEKCDINDETALKYIGVINTQSIKLKRLIEDLIEASKVSTGNVTINATKLNLSELAMQAIAEFSPEMEKNGNEIRFSEPETPPSIFADGSKTYRILSNLLSNAKKYSASDTRVYVSVYSDNINSYFEIKNISSEPLNISAEELTERFVRGDKSRTKEGNGLGLSIAKDLCTLQNGNLHITIDGDLFKVIVQLPATGNQIL